MSRLFKLIFICALLSACDSLKKSSIPDGTQISYRVYKIDSINTYYVIYATHANAKFKIISKKDYKKCSNKIQVDGQYAFHLHSLWTTPEYINGQDVSLQNTPHITCMTFDDSTKICIDRDSLIYDLFTCDNINGLCFLKKQ